MRNLHAACAADAPRSCLRKRLRTTYAQRNVAYARVGIGLLACELTRSLRISKRCLRTQRKRYETLGTRGRHCQNMFGTPLTDCSSDQWFGTIAGILAKQEVLQDPEAFRTAVVEHLCQPRPQGRRTRAELLHACRILRLFFRFCVFCVCLAVELHFPPLPFYSLAKPLPEPKQWDDRTRDPRFGALPRQTSALLANQTDWLKTRFRMLGDHPGIPI
jgi:hypothetical protein